MFENFCFSGMRWEYNTALYLWEIYCDDGRQVVLLATCSVFCPLAIFSLKVVEYCVILQILTLCIFGIYLLVDFVMKNQLSLSAIKILVIKLTLACRNTFNCANNGLWYSLCLRHSVLDSHAQESVHCRRSEALSVDISDLSRHNRVTSPVLWRIFQFAFKTRRRWMWICP
jgi:hypothetical protein